MPAREPEPIDDGVCPLSEAQARTLAALHDALIPADETGPGAVEANVPGFVERELAGALAEQREGYRRNLDALDRWARSSRGSSFAALEAPARAAALAELERGVEGFVPSSQAFFELARLHAIQGMFADPSHGGNAGYAGWDLIGFPGVKVVFAPEDQRLDTHVDPVRPERG